VLNVTLAATVPFVVLVVFIVLAHTFDALDGLQSFPAILVGPIIGVFFLKREYRRSSWVWPAMLAYFVVMLPLLVYVGLLFVGFVYHDFL